jgi:hypothetical protein
MVSAALGASVGLGVGAGVGALVGATAAAMVDWGVAGLFVDDPVVAGGADAIAVGATDWTAIGPACCVAGVWLPQAMANAKPSASRTRRSPTARYVARPECARHDESVTGTRNAAVGR